MDRYAVETVVTRRGCAPQFCDESWVPVEYFHIHRCIQGLMRSRSVRFRWTPPTRCKYHITFLGWRGDLAVDGAMAVLFHVDHPCGPLLLLYSIRSVGAVSPAIKPWELCVPIAELVAGFRDAHNRRLAYDGTTGFWRGIRRVGYFL
jgi:hypothetical protein